jgi:hypothetical protein
MASTFDVNPHPARAAISVRAVLGVVAAPVSLLCSGVVAEVYAIQRFLWLGVLLAIVLIAAAVFLSRWSPVTGYVAGGLLAALMLLYAATDVVPATLTPADLSISSILSFGGTGLLSAALVAVYIAVPVAARIRHSPA